MLHRILHLKRTTFDFFQYLFCVFFIPDIFFKPVEAKLILCIGRKEICNTSDAQYSKILFINQNYIQSTFQEDPLSITTQLLSLWRL